MVADISETLPPGGLLTLDDEDDYAVPESRISTTAAVRTRVNAMKREELTRSTRRATIQGLIDGNPPKSAAKLKSLGRGDEINFNTREGEGMADAAKTPYYTLTFRQQRFANITTDYGDQPQRQIEWSEKISARFHEMLKGWSAHDWNVQLRDWQMCVFGIGVCMWPDADSPFWKALKIGNAIVPLEVDADIDALPEACVPRDISPVDLYKMAVKNEKAAKAMGWFPDRVKKAIVQNADQTIRNQMGDNWGEAYQASLRRGDVSWNGKEHNIPIVDYLVMEFSGKITHVILLDDGGINNPVDDDDDDSMLFKKVGRFEQFSHVLCPFFFDIGTGEWHSIKGLGPKIFDFCNASNLTTCDMMTGTRNASKMQFQANDAAALQETHAIDIGAGKVWPPGLTHLQVRLDQNIQGQLAVKHDLQNTIQSNTGQYRQRNSGENQEPTLGQAQLNARNQQSLGDSAVDRHMNTLDKLYKEMVRRSMKWGKKLYSRYKDRDEPTLPPAEKLVFRFYKYLVEVDKVPEEALDFDYICSVSAVRGLGNGNPVSIDMATQGLIAMRPFMDERGKRNADRTRTAFLVGPNNVDAYFPPFEEADVPDDNVWAATQENNDLRTPKGETVVTPKQDHAIHFKVHFAALAGDFQSLKKGEGDPMEVLMFAHKMGPHMKEHLNEMAGDPTRKEQLEQMEEGWDMLSKLTDQLQQQIEEHIKSQEANPPQPQPDPELIAALARVQGELEIKRQKMQGDMQLKAEKQSQQMRLKDLSTAHGAKLKDREQMANTARDLREQAAAPVQNGATA